MLVKLEVSKVSGWLNACAFCRVQKGGRLRGRQAGQETGGRGGGSLSITCSVSPTGEWEAWAGAERTENMYCMLVTLDVSKLSGWLNAGAICQVKERSIGRRGDMRAGS